MRAKQILHFLLGSIPTFLSILQLIVCKPVKQEKIEKSRLKIEAAEKRLKNLNIQRQLRLHSEDNADKNEVEIDHSNRPKWIKKDMVQVKIKANMKRHRLTAKILRDNPEMKEIFDHRSSELRQQFNKLQRQKNKLKRTGLTDRKSIDLNLRDENSQFSKYDDKVTKCRKIIQKHQQNIRNLCSNPK